MARQVSCVSNVRQLAVAVRMYAADNDQRLVPARAGGAPPPSRGYTWCVLLQPYLKNQQVLTCPNDPKPLATLESTCLPHSYGINYDLAYNVGWGAGSLTRSMTHVTGHSTIILFFDMDSQVQQMGSSWKSYGISRVAPRHGGKAMFAFLDGHAKAVRAGRDHRRDEHVGGAVTAARPRDAGVPS